MILGNDDLPPSVITWANWEFAERTGEIFLKRTDCFESDVAVATSGLHATTPHELAVTSGAIPVELFRPAGHHV